MGKNKKKLEDQEQSDNSQQQDSDNQKKINTDNSPKDIPVAKLPEKLKYKKIVLNVSDTQYPIITEVGQQLGWIIQQQQGIGDWDVWWTDRQIQPHTLYKMNQHQKINHFPGIYVLARKNLLGLHLMAMQNKFPNQYNFFPQTWMIPMEFPQFRQYYQSVQQGKVRTYIVKPQALSQGRGIFLTRDINDILNGRKYVIQKYMKNPLLLDGLKFDLRIYVLLSGCQPLRLYIYQQGLVRLATRPYQPPTTDNLHQNYIHLTNYSLNKTNPDYVYNKSDKQMDIGHKRSLKSVYQKLARQGVNVQKLKTQIQDCIIKTVISGLPSIRHQYMYCQPEQYQGNMCFHILGFDVMILDDFKPIIIQVNHTPSFQTGTPLDYQIKKNLIKDTLKIMRITQKEKKNMFLKSKQITKKRIQTGKRDIVKGQERTKILKQVQKQRQIQQNNILLSTQIHNGYKRIYPFQDQKKNALFQKFYQGAEKVMKQQKNNRKKIISEENQSKKKNQNLSGSNKGIKNNRITPSQKLIVSQKNQKQKLSNQKSQRNQKILNKKLSLKVDQYDDQISIQEMNRSNKKTKKQIDSQIPDTVRQDKRQEIDFQTIKNQKSSNSQNNSEVFYKSQKKISSSHNPQFSLKNQGFQIRNNNSNKNDVKKISLNVTGLTGYSPTDQIYKSTSTKYTELMQKFVRSKELNQCISKTEEQEIQQKVIQQKFNQKNSRDFGDQQIYRRQSIKMHNLSQIKEQQERLTKKQFYCSFRQKNIQGNFPVIQKQKTQDSFVPKHQVLKHPRNIKNANLVNINVGNKRLIIQNYLSSQQEIKNISTSPNIPKQVRNFKSDPKLGKFIKPKTYNIHQNKFQNEDKLNIRMSPPTLHNFNFMNNPGENFGLTNINTPIYNFQHYNQLSTGIYPSGNVNSIQSHNCQKNIYQAKNKVQNVSKNISVFVNIKPSTGHTKNNSVVYKNNSSLPIKQNPILMKLIDKVKIKGYE